MMQLSDARVIEVLASLGFGQVTTVNDHHRKIAAAALLPAA